MTPHPIGGGFFHDRCGMVERTLTAVCQFRVRVLPQMEATKICPSHWLAEACHQLKAPISVSKLQNHHLARRVSRVKVIVTIKTRPSQSASPSPKSVAAVAKPNFKLFRRVSIWQPCFCWVLLVTNALNWRRKFKHDAEVCSLCGKTCGHDVRAGSRPDEHVLIYLWNHMSRHPQEPPHPRRTTRSPAGLGSNKYSFLTFATTMASAYPTSDM